MTRGHRIGALALAALVAVVAFVALRPEDEDSNIADRRATLEPRGPRVPISRLSGRKPRPRLSIPRSAFAAASL
jgi:hypothetical protein